MNGFEDVKKVREEYKLETGIDPAIIIIESPGKIIPSYTEWLEHKYILHKCIIDNIKKDKGN